MSVLEEDAARRAADTASLGERLGNAVRKLDPREGNGPTVLKLVLYGALCLGLLAFLVALIGNRAFFSDRSGYSAELNDATGLFNSDSVRISGVPVGRVTGIDTDRGVAVVEFELDDHIELPADTQVGVRWRNVLGQKYLYLYPGESDEILEPGDRIPVGQAVEGADFGRFLNEIGPVLRAADPEDGNAFVRAFAEALEGNEARARQLIADAAVVTGAVGELDTEIGTIITQFEDLLTAVAQRDDDLASLVEDLASTSQTLADNNQILAEVITSFREVQEQLRAVVEGNRGDIDALIENLVVIGDTLEANLDSLDRGLATMPTGLAPYHEISAQGQWFNVRARILCFAGQTTCVSEDPLNLQPIVPPGTDAGASAAGGQGGRSGPMAGTVSDVLDAVRGGVGS